MVKKQNDCGYTCSSSEHKILTETSHFLYYKTWCF